MTRLAAFLALTLLSAVMPPLFALALLVLVSGGGRRAR